MARAALIVEADAARAAQYADLLERRGFTPVVAQSGDEAIFLAARSGRLALILIEATLPDMDGLTALRELRAASSQHDCPALVLVASRGAYDEAARAMIPLHICGLLPATHSMASLARAIDRALRGDAPARDEVAQAKELPAASDDAEAIIPEHLAAHPMAQELARTPGLLNGSDDDLRRVAASTARVFGAAVGLLWIEHGQRSSFALHMEDAIPRGSPLRVADRWQPVRALIANLPVYVPDVSEHRAFSASPLLPSGAPATLIGVPLRLGARTAGAVAIVQPHVVGHLGRGMLEPLVFWAQRLAGDLLGLDASAPTRGLPVSPPLPQAIPLSQAVESIAAVLDVALLASDETGVVCYANPALLALIGAARRDVLGHKRAIVLRRLASAAGAQDGVVSAIVGATTTGIPSDFTVEKPRSAVLRWRARPLPLPGDTTGTLDEFADVTREFERARARETLVRVDAATRLPNRTGIDDALGVEVARSLRTGEPFCVAMFALDQPHRAAAGDELFRQVAWLLRSTARRHDVVGRLDGLRLVAILTNTRADQALALCERFGTAVRELDVQGCRTTASAGVAQFDAGKTIRDVLDEATAHLSAARRLGGDRALAEIRQTAG